MPTEAPVKLISFSIKGYKSIKELPTLEAKQINILIGANGAGKSNLISFFKLLRTSLIPAIPFQEHIARLGGAEVLLHLGTAVTKELECTLSIDSGKGLNDYYFRYGATGPKSMAYFEEKLRYSDNAHSDTKGNWIHIGKLSEVSQLSDESTKNPTAKSIIFLLRQIIVYQFHDTGENAKIRKSFGVNSGKVLHDDASNLGSFIYNMSLSDSDYFKRLVSIIQLVFPQFERFDLIPFGSQVLLCWFEKGSNYSFDASQASDGTLRFMALAALLTQPKDKIAKIIFIDEPELGLHPTAISVLASLIKEASVYSQIFVSTQSPEFIDFFEPEDIIVVEKDDKQSTFTRHNKEELKSWLVDYSLGDIWKMNLIGGRP